MNHFGTIEFGHYTAYARSRDDGCWRLFNDATVGVRDDDEVSQASRAPYFLFLLREDVAPAEWVRQGKLREEAALERTTAGAEANAETERGLCFSVRGSGAANPRDQHATLQDPRSLSWRTSFF